jgi:hypothetical protein
VLGGGVVLLRLLLNAAAAAAAAAVPIHVWRAQLVRRQACLLPAAALDLCVCSAARGIVL